MSCAAAATAWSALWHRAERPERRAPRPSLPLTCSPAASSARDRNTALSSRSSPPACHRRTMLLPKLLALAASLVPATLAVFADDAYHVDYHFALLGQPQQHATFFHQPRPETKASLLYSLSDKLVLGAVNPKDGSAVWRQKLPSGSGSADGFLRAGENQDIVISAVEGQVAAWDAADGKLVWTSTFRDAPVKDLEVLELADASAAASGVKDAIVLLGGSSSTVRRLDGQTGAVKWEFEDNR